MSWRSLSVGHAQEGDPVRHLSGWGMVAFGPYLMLQLTLLANLGRAQMLTGAARPQASLPPLLGLAAGAAVIALVASPVLRVVAAAVSVLDVLPGWLGREG